MLQCLAFFVDILFSFFVVVFLLLLSCSLVLLYFINRVFLFCCFLVINTRPLHGARFGCNFARQIIQSSCPFVLSEKTSRGGLKPPTWLCYNLLFSCPLVLLFLCSLVPLFSCSSVLCLLVHLCSFPRVIVFSLVLSLLLLSCPLIILSPCSLVRVFSCALVHRCSCPLVLLSLLVVSTRPMHGARFGCKFPCWRPWLIEKL